MADETKKTSPRTSQRLALALANSMVLRGGKAVHLANAQDWKLGGSFSKKFLANLYLILHDFGDGSFPPKLPSREELFEIERSLHAAVEFQSYEASMSEGMGKPFNGDMHMLKHYLWAYAYLVQLLDQKGVPRGAKMMEFGCGFGWLTELLAIRGYDMMGTTIAPDEVSHANTRIDSLAAKGLKVKLRFSCSPMEELVAAAGPNQPFDVVFCFEALHHAFDWRVCLDAATKIIRPGGWLMLCSEPTAVHTYICYRSSKILKTYEIGFHRKDLVNHLKGLGYGSIKVAQPVKIDRLRDGWKRLLPVDLNYGSVMARSMWISARKN